MSFLLQKTVGEVKAYGATAIFIKWLGLSMIDMTFNNIYEPHLPLHQYIG